MLHPARQQRRQGTSCVEFAITCPIVFFLIFAIIVGSMGVFRYQQVAALAREGARWASVHGGEYADTTGQPAATASDVYTTAMAPLMVALDTSKFTYSVTWNKSNYPVSLDPTTQDPIANTVTVTVNYQWVPEMYLVGPYVLTSTSTAQMMY